MQSVVACYIPGTSLFLDSLDFGTEFHVLILHVIGLVLEQKKGDSFMVVKTVVYLWFGLHSPRTKQNGMT